MFDALECSESVLLAGAGGGFDVFGALPLYFALRSKGKRCHLANFSFTFPEFAFPIVSLSKGYRERLLTPSTLAVDAELEPFGPYFPELYLSRWFQARGEAVPVYTFAMSGAAPLAEGYRTLVERLSIDAVILVDGGADSLMRGDEEDLATPSEDVASVVAVNALDVPVKILACVGFGADWHHGLSHGRAIEASAELAARGGFLGVFSMIKGMPEAELYREACEYVFGLMRGQESIVSSSILSALDGRFGDWHAFDRTRGGRMWVSPLMSAYWCYSLPAVASRMLYSREALAATKSIEDVSRVILEFRRTLRTLRPRLAIPI